MYSSASHGPTSWLDHAVCTTSMHALIQRIHIDYSMVTSDHLPITVELNMQLVDVNHRMKPNIPNRQNIAWDNISCEERIKYSCLTDKYLSRLKLDHTALCCSNPMCKDVSHTNAIDLMYQEVVSALKGASADFHVQSSKPKASQVQGWNEFCKELHSEARRAFLDWRASSSPKHGIVYSTMRSTRAAFKLALRKCRADKTVCPLIHLLRGSLGTVQLSGMRLGNSAMRT